MRYAKIEKALSSELLSKDMCTILPPPKQEEIAHTQKQMNVVFSDSHIDLLLCYGGFNLDEIRIRGLDSVKKNGDAIEFADDYNGYIFQYRPDGSVFIEDTDGGNISVLASSVLEFINEIFLGEKGGAFYGEEWGEELRGHGIA